MSAALAAGRTPECPGNFNPLPPAPVPTVVAIRTKRAKVRMVICTAMTTCNDVVDDQPAADTAAERAAVQSRASITVPFEHDRTHALPSLRAIIGIVHL